jgi:alpha-L-fucosidase 2
MRRKLLFLLWLTCIVIHSNSQNNYILRYKQPAKEWNEALPIGNGRLGAMVYGGIDKELLQLNEQTLWTGGPVDHNPNPTAATFLQPVRTALFMDSINQASRLLRKMQGPDTEMYQPLGDVMITQTLEGAISNYQRTLDISDPAASTEFKAGNTLYTRKIFVSAPDQVIIMKLTADKPGALNFSVDVKHELHYQKKIISGNELLLLGKARITNDERRCPKPFIYEDSAGCDGMRFQFRVKIKLTGGTLSTTDTSLVVRDAQEAIVFISAATSFNGYDKCPVSDGKDEAAIASGFMNKAFKKSFTSLWETHLADYRKYFDRLKFVITPGKDPGIPTDSLLVQYRSGKNPSQDRWLEELYFHFGRYLLICSSRPGGIPANLQGIWNNLIRPPWRSNYTTNINLQMNYWLALPCNLAEMNQPLVEHIKRFAANGTYTAHHYYNMHGWAVHHNSDIWAQTNPVGEGNGDPKWANWALGSPWLSQHLYEHYRFTQDKKYLAGTAYPLMKSAAEFCLDWLVEKDGSLVTAPSTSPENVYLHPAGYKGTATIASAMDMEIIWDLFTNTIEAASILGKDAAFVELLKEKRNKLHPLQVGKKGNLVEWYGDWEDEDPLHRHVSHAFGLHPGRQIAPSVDSVYSNAVRKTLETRGDGGTGWSKAWKINFWARLLDGDHAYKMYQELLKSSTLNNLFDTHPPFQIDGNFGATAGVTEMLLQSHLDDIQLLPALPAAWKNGYVKGLMARGNFEIELTWKNGQLTQGSIISRSGNKCRIRSAQRITFNAGAIKVETKQQIVNGQVQYIYSFPTVAGKKYSLSIK